jgi:hypothetical protein
MMMTRWKNAFTGVLFLMFTVTAAQIVQGQQVTPVFVGPVTLPASHGYCGIYVYQAFNGTAGEVLTGSVSANSSVNVYVMTAAGFHEWQHQVVGGICKPSSPIASQINTTSYNLNAKIPVTGTYYLVVNNLSYSMVTAKITANLA